MLEHDIATRTEARDGWAVRATWAALCTVAGLLVVFDAPAGVRAPFVLVAMIGGPGWALCGSLRVRDRNLLRAIAISVGLSVNVLLGLAMIATHTWRPVGASVLLLFGSAFALASRPARRGMREIGLDAGGGGEGWEVPALWAVLCAGAAVLVVFDVHSGLRAPLVLVAMIAGPGWALCGSLPIRDKNLVRAIAISVGLAVNVTLALALIAVDTWRPVGASVLLLLSSALLLASRSVRIAARAITGGDS